MWNVRLARRQVRQFEQFSQPSVVPFVDVGTSGGLHYLAWPLIEGESMEAAIQRDGKAAHGMAALYCLQVATGLAACHHHGIFHGLLKPSNLMLDQDSQVHILDFGIGSLLAENEGESLVDTMSTANTMTSGLDCASPESIMEPTNRTAAGDQYSLGCCLYFFLTGKYPFPEGSAVEKMMAHQYKQPTPVKELAPDAPDELAEIVERLMQKTPEQRFSNSDEVVEALRPLASPQPPPRPRPPSAQGTQRRPDNGVPGRPGRPGEPPSRTRASSQGIAPTRGSAQGVGPSRGSAPGTQQKPGKSSNPSLRPPISPTGKSMRGNIASPGAPPKRELPPEDDEEADDADASAEDEEEEEDEEDEEEESEARVNPRLVTILAVIACGLAFWVALRLFQGEKLWPFGWPF